VNDQSFAADWAELVREFNEAIDQLEAAVVACPDALWRASMWHVPRSDPWMWPMAGVEPVPERTDESIQSFSAVANVVYHCLWFLDYYQSADPVDFASPEYDRGGPQELAFADDGAAPITDWVFSKDVLLRYLDHGRRTLNDLLRAATDSELAERCPVGHPHGGSSLLELQQINLRHVREHGDSVRTFLVERGIALQD
jgi:hypothetical protein